MVHPHLRFFSMEWKGIAIAIAKMDRQPILEPNGYANRVIDLGCEWILRTCSRVMFASTSTSTLTLCLWCWKCKRREWVQMLWVQIHSRCLCLRYYWCNVKLVPCNTFASHGYGQVRLQLWDRMWDVFHPSQPMPGGFPLRVFFHPQKGLKLFWLEPSHKANQPVRTCSRWGKINGFAFTWCIRRHNRWLASVNRP